jgi:hypothetical protein
MTAIKCEIDYASGGIPQDLKNLVEEKRKLGVEDVVDEDVCRKYIESVSERGLWGGNPERMVIEKALGLEVAVPGNESGVTSTTKIVCEQVRDHCNLLISEAASKNLKLLNCLTNINAFILSPEVQQYLLSHKDVDLTAIISTIRDIPINFTEVIKARMLTIQDIELVGQIQELLTAQLMREEEEGGTPSLQLSSPPPNTHYQGIIHHLLLSRD